MCYSNKGTTGPTARTDANVIHVTSELIMTTITSKPKYRYWLGTIGIFKIKKIVISTNSKYSSGHLFKQFVVQSDFFIFFTFHDETFRLALIVDQTMALIAFVNVQISKIALKCEAC